MWQLWGSQVVFVSEILAQIRIRGIDLDRLAQHKALKDGLTCDKKEATLHLTKLLVDEMQKWLPVTQADSGAQHQIAALQAEIAEPKPKAGSAPPPEAPAPEVSSQPSSRRASSPIEAALRGNKPAAFDPAQLLVTPGNINPWLQTNMPESFNDTKYKAWFKGLKLDIVCRQAIGRTLLQQTIGGKINLMKQNQLSIELQSAMGFLVERSSQATTRTC